MANRKLRDEVSNGNKLCKGIQISQFLQTFILFYFAGCIDIADTLKIFLFHVCMTKYLIIHVTLWSLHITKIIEVQCYKIWMNQFTTAAHASFNVILSLKFIVKCGRARCSKICFFLCSFPVCFPNPQWNLFFLLLMFMFKSGESWKFWVVFGIFETF